MTAVPYDLLAMERLMSRMHFDGRCWALAMGYYNIILGQEPGNADALYQRALCAMHLGNQLQACEDFAVALSLDAEHKHAGKAYNFRGDYFKSIGDFARAVECYTPALTAGSTIQHVFSRGECLFELDRHSEAIPDLSTVILKGHGLAQAYYLRGQCLFHLQDWQQARDDFTEDINLNPQRAEAFLMRGKCYMQEKNFARALIDLNEAIRLFEQSRGTDSLYFVELSHGVHVGLAVGEAVEISTDADALLTDPILSYAYEMRGQCSLFQGEPTAALSDLSEAVRLDPTSASAFACRGNCYMTEGAWATASTDLERSLELDPSAIQSCQWLGECLFELGQYETSITWFSTVIKNGAEGQLLVDATSYRAQAHVKLSQWESALADYDATIRSGGELTALGHHQYGLSLYGIGCYHMVRDHLDTSLRLNEDVPLLAADTLTLRARLYTREANYRAAETDFAEALRLLANSGDKLRLSGLYEMRGEERYLEGRFEEALPDLNKALELNADRLYSYYWRARCFSDLKQWAAAMDNFKEGLSRTKNGQEAAVFYTSRGYCLMLQKHRRRAIQDFDRAIDLDPEVPSPYRGRASVKMVQEKWWEALADLNTLLAMPENTVAMPNLAELYEMRAQCNEAIGNDEEADCDRDEADRLRGQPADGSEGEDRA